MDKDYGELIKYLDGKFTGVNDRFGLVDKRFDIVDERLTRLEDLIEAKADKSDVQNLMSSIDRLAKAIEIYHDEQKAIVAKIDIHEKWIHQIAEKLGIKLEY